MTTRAASACSRRASARLLPLDHDVKPARTLLLLTFPLAAFATIEACSSDALPPRTQTGVHTACNAATGASLDVSGSLAVASGGGAAWVFDLTDPVAACVGN